MWLTDMFPIKSRESIAANDNWRRAAGYLRDTHGVKAPKEKKNKRKAAKLARRKNRK